MSTNVRGWRNLQAIGTRQGQDGMGINVRLRRLQLSPQNTPLLLDARIMFTILLFLALVQPSTVIVTRALPSFVNLD